MAESYVINYFHSDLKTATELAKDEAHLVWCYVPGEKELKPLRGGENLPSGATYAIIGRMATMAAGATVGAAVERKDPLPKPPPVPRIGDTPRTAYFGDAAVVEFLRSVDRSFVIAADDGPVRAADPDAAVSAAEAAPADVPLATAPAANAAIMDGDPSSYHVLLIGIDAYAVKPLYGCVNDIDAIQRLLTGPGLAVPPERITRLASPQPGATHETGVPEQPATLANIRAALTHLGSAAVGPGDRVFIFYSGHGSRVPVTAGPDILHREVMVPVDFNLPSGVRQFLFDFEINRLLGAITTRTTSVTLVLECCHSAGIPRDVPEDGTIARVLDYVVDLGGIGPVELAEAEASGLAAAARGIGSAAARGTSEQAQPAQALPGTVDDCLVAAACHSHEVAWESPDATNHRQGHFARALLAELKAVSAPDLATVPWARIWQGVRARVLASGLAQNVWMDGSAARQVFAGPPVDGDIGLGVRQVGEAYEVDAGSLAAVTPGAKLAVYGSTPRYFPPLASPEDLQQRFTVLLEVTEASPARAKAKALGPTFELPPGARGRLVEVGDAARVRCAVVPADAAVVAAVRRSPLVEIVDAASTSVHLSRRDGTWVLTDGVIGHTPGGSVLCTLTGPELAQAPHVLEQYFYYTLPMRMANACKDLPGMLQVSLHRCPERPLTPDERKGQGLSEATSGARFTYDLRSGEKVAIFVRNQSVERLLVTVLNAAGSGKVQLLGKAVLEPRSLHIFWAQGMEGEPFDASLPAGANENIDRLVAIGTSLMGTNLDYLKLDSRFAEVAAGVPVGGPIPKELDDRRVANPIPDRWTASEIVWRCWRPG